MPSPIPQIEGGTRPIVFFFGFTRVVQSATPRVDRRGAGPLKDWSRWSLRWVVVDTLGGVLFGGVRLCFWSGGGGTTTRRCIALQLPIHTAIGTSWKVAGLHTPKSEGPSLLQGSALAGAELEA